MFFFSFVIYYFENVDTLILPPHAMLELFKFLQLPFWLEVLVAPAHQNNISLGFCSTEMQILLHYISH